MTTLSAIIVYDKSVFDTASIGNEGRYAFKLRQDSAAEETAAGSQTAVGSQAKEEMKDASPSLIKIEDASPAGGSSSSSESDEDFLPSLDGPSG